MIVSTRLAQENWRWRLYLWRMIRGCPRVPAQETLRTLDYIERPATCIHTPSYSTILGGSIEHCPAMKFYYGVCNFDTMNDVAFANLRYELTTTGHENRWPTFNSSRIKQKVVLWFKNIHRKWPINNSNFERIAQTIMTINDHINDLIKSFLHCC